MKKSGTVSVVILTWNRRDDLRFTLERLKLENHAPLEVIVVDNNSTDGTAAMMAAGFPQFRYLPQSENLGIAGYNIGFKAAAGEYIVVLDSDSYPARDAITRMAAIFERHPEAGIVAFDVHAATGVEEEPVSGAAVAEVYGYHGAGAGIRRAVFEKAGYWWEPFFLYFNEMDHALRALREGFAILHSPAVRAYHKSSPVGRPSGRGAFYYTRNAFWIVWRHYPLWAMCMATAYLIYNAIGETFWQGTTVYLRAMAAAFGGAGAALRERRPLHPALFARTRIPLKLVFTRFG
ncbi:MAG: glycosyltransferase family 2 protein [Nitrospinae bacterium]|nr:glycosyltransferase family 2 protein [Nitrospinota bacterium]